MKLTYGEIADICRNLALLQHAGIGMADGAFLLAEEETGKNHDLLKALAMNLDSGMNLSAAMEKSDAFPACATGMVYVGEQTGCLEDVLHATAQFYEQRSRSNRQIKNALTYPAVMLALMLVVVGVLLVKVLPVFDDVYGALGSRMNGVAAALLQLGRGLEAALPALFAVLAVLAVAVLVYAYCTPVKNKVNAWWLARFGDGGIWQMYNNANFARALAIGLACGLPLEDAVEQAGKLLADIPAAAQRCRNCAALLRGGAQLSNAMKETKFLPPSESRMLAVGLRQGNADQVMADIANRLMEQADEAMENAASKIEPAMVLTASILVGMILLAVMLPLMNIMTVIG